MNIAEVVPSQTLDVEVPAEAVDRRRVLWQQSELCGYCGKRIPHYCGASILTRADGTLALVHTVDCLVRASVAEYPTLTPHRVRDRFITRARQQLLHTVSRGRRTAR